MNYLDFKEEFKKVLKKNASSKTVDLIEEAALAAWMAFGRLNAKEKTKRKI